MGADARQPARVRTGIRPTERGSAPTHLSHSVPARAAARPAHETCTPANNRGREHCPGGIRNRTLLHEYTQSGNRRDATTALQQGPTRDRHILLDVVRCPRQPGEIFSRQLGYFNAHVAKGLYATYDNIFAPADLPEIRRYMDSECKMLYLDGPNDVDWIFQNDILREREESIYVDYVDYNDATRRERFWHCPNARMMAIGVWDGARRC